jgi:endonuclease III
VLDEKPDLPDECPALVEIMPLSQAARDEEIARNQIELMRKAPRVGKLLYKKREDLYER